MRRLLALVRGLSPDAAAWRPDHEPATQAPAMKLGRAAQLIGG